jgi:hypothetical protein
MFANRKRFLNTLDIYRALNREISNGEAEEGRGEGGRPEHAMTWSFGRDAMTCRLLGKIGLS